MSYARAGVLDSLPGKHIAHTVEAPRPQAAEVHVRTAIAQVEALPYEGRRSLDPLAPQLRLLLRRLVARCLVVCGEVDAAQKHGTPLLIAEERITGDKLARHSTAHSGTATHGR